MPADDGIIDPMVPDATAMLFNAAHALRIVLFVAGFAIFAFAFLFLATMPPPSPGSDGWAHGMATLVGGLATIVALGIGVVAVVLPSVLRRNDPLGFNRWQRRALTGAGALFGGGFVIGVAFGYLSHFGMGGLLWIMFIVVAAAIVGVTLVWRLGEVAFYRLDDHRTGSLGGE